MGRLFAVTLLLLAGACGNDTPPPSPVTFPGLQGETEPPPPPLPPRSLLPPQHARPPGFREARYASLALDRSEWVMGYVPSNGTWHVVVQRSDSGVYRALPLDTGRTTPLFEEQVGPGGLYLGQRGDQRWERRLAEGGAVIARAVGAGPGQTIQILSTTEPGWHRSGLMVRGVPDRAPAGAALVSEERGQERRLRVVSFGSPSADERVIDLADNGIETAAHIQLAASSSGSAAIVYGQPDTLLVTTFAADGEHSWTRRLALDGFRVRGAHVVPSAIGDAVVSLVGEGGTLRLLRFVDGEVASDVVFEAGGEISGAVPFECHGEVGVVALVQRDHQERALTWVLSDGHVEGPGELAGMQVPASFGRIEDWQMPKVRCEAQSAALFYVFPGRSAASFDYVVAEWAVGGRAEPQ